MDVVDEASVHYVFDRVRPHVVIHCAALGSVDYCERNPECARITNVGGVAHILNAALAHRAKVVFISSNAVFGGNGAAPYAEDDGRFPVNMYGVLKKHAEDLVMEYYEDWLIVRPIMLYGWPYRGGRSNWATRVIEFLKAGLPLKIVDDTVTQPTYAADCAEAIWKLIAADETGIFHVGGCDRLSLYGFAMSVANVWGLDGAGLLEPVSSDYFSNIVRRPQDATYDLTRMISCVANPVRLHDGLERMLKE